MEELGRLGVEQWRSQVAASARSACGPGEKGQQRNERYKLKTVTKEELFTATKVEPGPLRVTGSLTKEKNGINA